MKPNTGRQPMAGQAIFSHGNSLSTLIDGDYQTQ
jgi:hypothetical protein